MVTSKPAQLLQNGHFAETRFGVLTKNVSGQFLSKKFSSTPRKFFQQRACFGGPVNVWTSLADAPRKFIARHVGFSLLRPLAEG